MKKLFTVLIGIMMVVVLSAQHTNSYTYPLYVGKIGVSTGSITLKGITSGSAQLIVNAAAGSVVLTLPSTTGTFATTQNINDSLDAFVALGATLSDLAVMKAADTLLLTADHTLTLADAWRWITVTKASLVTVTIPTNASVAFPVGTIINFLQGGAGEIKFEGSFHAALDSAYSNTLWNVCTIRKRATDNWTLIGTKD